MPDGRAGSAAILPSMVTTERLYGAQSMSSPLLDVLVKRPGPAFGAAFDDPAHGFLHPVDLDLARRQHDAFVETLASLGPRVHVLETELATPDLVYTFDPLLVTDRGAIPLRPGKPNRAPEPAAIEAWTSAAGIPTIGRIEAPGTIEGGDTFWLRPDLFCIGRTLRTNGDGAAQLADTRRWRRSHLRRPVLARPERADPPHVGHLTGRRRSRGRLPAAPPGRAVAASRWTWEIRLVEVPDDEFPTLGCNVLAVRPGVVILAEGNPRTAAALAAAGCEVHTYPATEIGINGSGGPTCMTRPILRG